MMTGISDFIDRPSLYVLLPHFRPSDVTPEKSVFLRLVLSTCKCMFKILQQDNKKIPQLTRSARLKKEAWPRLFKDQFSANLGLNFNPGFFFFSSKALSRIIFSILLEYPITKLQAKRIRLDLFFKLSYLSSNFALTLGYLNPASNNLVPPPSPF